MFKPQVLTGISQKNPHKFLDVSLQALILPFITEPGILWGQAHRPESLVV